MQSTCEKAMVNSPLHASVILTNLSQLKPKDSLGIVLLHARRTPELIVPRLVVFRANNS